MTRFVRTEVKSIVLALSLAVYDNGGLYDLTQKLYNAC